MTFHAPITAQTVHITDHFRARFAERIGPADCVDPLCAEIRAEIERGGSDRVQYLGRQGRAGRRRATLIHHGVSIVVVFRSAHDVWTFITVYRPEEEA